MARATTPTWDERVPRTRPRRNPWDVGATLAMVAASAVFCVVAGVFVVWADFSFEACQPGACDRELGDWGWRVGAFAPSIILAFLLIVLIGRFRRRVLGWPAALAALVLQSAALAASSWMITMALAGGLPSR